MPDPGVVVTGAQFEAAFPATEGVGDTMLEGIADPDDRTRIRAAVAHARVTLRAATREPDLFVSPSDPLTARIQSVLAEQAQQSGQVAPLASGGLEAKYDKRDALGWLLRFPAEWLAAPARRPFAPIPAVEPVSGELRLALFSDWGTGMYGAPLISHAIKSDVERFDYVFHLGDVYYAGTNHEFDKNVLDLWPKPPGAVGRMLNGNHEMYSGGAGYFDIGLPYLNQPSSVVALQNDHWIILGLDTAYLDFDLAPGQAEWIQGLLQNLGGRRVIVLSHHQLFSNTGSPQGTKLQHRLEPVLDARKIHAWYWGHEHVCALYDKHPRWGLYGRCIGHAGMPEFRGAHPQTRTQPEETLTDSALIRIAGSHGNPDCLLLDGPNPDIPGHQDNYLPHGYMTLRLDGPRLVEELRNSRGALLRSVELT